MRNQKAIPQAEAALQKYLAAKKAQEDSDRLIVEMLGPPVDHESQSLIDVPPIEYIPVSAKLIDAEITGFDYVIENIFIKGYQYTLTGSNNHGKTTLMALMIEAITSGGLFAGNRVIQGNVLILSGENVTDTILKFRLLPNTNLDLINIIPLSFDMKQSVEDVLTQIKFCGIKYVAVFVDSAQAYFGRGDMNGNSEILDHFKAMRRFTAIEGNPFVCILAHPVKNPDPSNLVPYGGGSVMNEIDTNLTLITTRDGIATLGIQKKRQPGFADINFALKSEVVKGLMTNFGSPVTSSRFEHIPYVEAAKIEQMNLDDQDVVLMLFDSEIPPSLQNIGKKVWPDLVEGASKSRAKRVISDLCDLRFVEKTTGGKYELTARGRKKIKNIKESTPF